MPCDEVKQLKKKKNQHGEGSMEVSERAITSAQEGVIFFLAKNRL